MGSTTPLATLGALVLGLSAPMGPLNAQAATGEPTDTAFAWSERGVFVFRNATFDFQEQKLAFHFGSETLVDCSDGEYFCLDGGPFALSLPRSCEAAKLPKRLSTKANGPIRATSFAFSGSPKWLLRFISR